MSIIKITNISTVATSSVMVTISTIHHGYYEYYCYNTLGPDARPPRHYPRDRDPEIRKEKRLLETMCFTYAAVLLKEVVSGSGSRSECSTCGDIM